MNNIKNALLEYMIANRFETIALIILAIIVGFLIVTLGLIITLVIMIFVVGMVVGILFGKPSQSEEFNRDKVDN